MATLGILEKIIRFLKLFIFLIRKLWKNDISICLIQKNKTSEGFFRFKILDLDSNF